MHLSGYIPVLICSNAMDCMYLNVLHIEYLYDTVRDVYKVFKASQSRLRNLDLGTSDPN